MVAVGDQVRILRVRDGLDIVGEVVPVVQTNLIGTHPIQIRRPNGTTWWFKNGDFELIGGERAGGEEITFWVIFYKINREDRIPQIVVRLSREQADRFVIDVQNARYIVVGKKKITTRLNGN